MTNITQALKRIRRKAGLLALLPAACLLLLLPGCQGPMGPQQDARHGTVALTLGAPNLGRAIMPDADLGSFDRFGVAFFQGGSQVGLTHYTYDLSDEITRDKPVGSVWTVKATAYFAGEGDGPDYVLAARGENYFTVQTGLNRISVALSPIRDGEGDGVFAWAITLANEIGSATMSVFEFCETDEEWAARPMSMPDSVDLKARAIGSETLPSGVYRVRVHLVIGSSETAIYYVLRVYQNMTSNFERYFSEAYARRTLAEIVAEALAEGRTDGIFAADFAALGVQGVTDGNLGDIADAAEALVAASADGVPADAAELKVLVDAALVRIWSEGSIDGIASRSAAATAISEQIKNSSTVGIVWNEAAGSLNKATVGIGLYSVEIAFAGIDCGTEIVATLAAINGPITIGAMPEGLVFERQQGTEPGNSNYFAKALGDRLSDILAAGGVELEWNVTDSASRLDSFTRLVVGVGIEKDGQEIDRFDGPAHVFISHEGHTFKALGYIGHFMGASFSQWENQANPVFFASEPGNYVVTFTLFDLGPEGDAIGNNAIPGSATRLASASAAIAASHQPMRFSLYRYDLPEGMTALGGNFEGTLESSRTITMQRSLVDDGTGRSLHDFLFAMNIDNATVTEALLAGGSMALTLDGAAHNFSFVPLALANDGQYRVWQHNGASIMRYRGETVPENLSGFGQTPAHFASQDGFPNEWASGHVFVYMYEGHTQVNLQHSSVAGAPISAAAVTVGGRTLTVSIDGAASPGPQFSLHSYSADGLNSPVLDGFANLNVGDGPLTLQRSAVAGSDFHSLFFAMNVDNTTVTFAQLAAAELTYTIARDDNATVTLMVVPLRLNGDETIWQRLSADGSEWVDVMHRAGISSNNSDVPEFGAAQIPAGEFWAYMYDGVTEFNLQHTAVDESKISSIELSIARRTLEIVISSSESND